MVDSLKGLFGGGEEQPAAPAPPAAAKQRRRAQRAQRANETKEERRARRAQEEDFVKRYMSGPPSEGFTTQEALQNLQRVRKELTPAELQQAVQQTVQNLPPDQRAAFAQMLEQRKAGQGMVKIERTGGAQAGPAGDPMGDLFGGLLGGLLGGAAAPAPAPGRSQGGPGVDDMLGGLLGGLLGAPVPAQGRAQAPGGSGLDDLFGTLLGGGMTGAMTPTSAPAPQQRQDDGPNMGDILGNPLTKAVLGGVAAFAMKQVLEKNR